jgi:cell wall-associated NlpC family hydrolase
MGQHADRAFARIRTRIGMMTVVIASCSGALALAVPAAHAAPTASATVTARTATDPLAGFAVGALAELTTWSRTGSAADLSAYATTRDAIATAVAGRLALDPALMRAAWSRADVPHQTALLAAMTQLGVPYRTNASKPGVAFDCSGLTTYAWGVAGRQIARQSGTQIKAAVPLTQETAQAGDLMYYPGHAMMYLGVDRAMIHSPYSGKTVEVNVQSKKRTLRFGEPVPPAPVAP